MAWQMIVFDCKATVGKAYVDLSSFYVNINEEVIKTRICSSDQK